MDISPPLYTTLACLLHQCSLTAVSWEYERNKINYISLVTDALAPLNPDLPSDRAA